METKICSKCKEEKSVSQFSKNKALKDGYHGYCKLCDKNIKKIYRENLKKQNDIIILDNNIKRICTICKEQKQLDCFGKDSSKPLGRRYECKSCRAQQQKSQFASYTKEQKEKIKQRQKQWRENPKNKTYRKTWDKKNYERLKQKYHNDIVFRFKKNASSLIRNSLGRKYKKQNKTEKILNTTLEAFSKHIEAQFLNGMNWDNRNDWHLDHIIPISLAQNESEAIRLNDYRNFSPKWKFDNMSKHNKIIVEELKPIHYELYDDILERNRIKYD